MYRGHTMLEENLRCLREDGFCIVEDIIPEAKIDEVHDSVVQAQASHHERAEAEPARTRTRGHRIGTQGVGTLKQIINETQAFSPYLADRRILDIVEALFGPHARISCTDCGINHPGNARGYLHADWPYNATNATNAANIPAPYPDTPLHLSTIWMLSPSVARPAGPLSCPEVTG